LLCGSGRELWSCHTTPPWEVPSQHRLGASRMTVTESRRSVRETTKESQTSTPAELVAVGRRIGRRGRKNWLGDPDTPTNPRGGGERRPKPHGCRVRTECNYRFVILSRRRWWRFGTTTPLEGLQLPSRKSRFLGSDTEPLSKKRETQPVSAGEGSETTPERRKRGYNSRVLQLRAGRRTPRYRLVTRVDRDP
jgi:hypothetical protein